MSDTTSRWTVPAPAAAVVHDLRRCLPQLVAYEILFRIISAAALAPLVAWGVTRLISTTGKLAVSNEEIVSFGLSLTGVLTLVLIGTSSIAILFAEHAGAMLIARSAVGRQRPSATGALLRTGKALPRLFQLGLLQLAGYSLAALPFALLALLAYAALLSGRDINYYLAEQPPVFWAALAIGGLLLGGFLVVAAVLYVWWIFSVPLLIFEKSRPLAALRRSRRLVRGAWLRIAALVLGCLAALAVLASGVAILLDLIGGAVLAVVGHNLAMVIPAVAALLAVDLLAGAAVTFLGLSVTCILIVQLYFEACRSSGLAVSAGAPEASETEPLPSTRLSRRAIVWLTAAVLLVLTGIFSYVVIEYADMEDQVAVTAHRGSSRKAPENTLAAIEMAVRDGADFAEIDVQETADGVVVLLHDADLMRIAGVDKKIWAVRYDEINTLDVGSWFSPDFADQRIATLRQAIEAARGRIRLNIELKFNGHDQKLAERVAEIVRSESFEPQCVVTSLEYDGLTEAKRHNGRLEAGLIVFRALGDVTRLDVDFLSVNADNVNHDLVERVRRHGKNLHVWTVNDVRKMSAMIDLGVDNIITDEPATLVALRDERASLTNAEKILLAFKNRLAR